MLAKPGSGPINRIWGDPYMVLPPNRYGFDEKPERVINVAGTLGVLLSLIHI